MASSISIASNSGGGTYYISGSNAGANAYTGSGTPWTAQSTTPIELVMNGWTPNGALGQLIWQGGPPFRYGSSLVAAGQGNVTETIPILIRATTYDAAVSILVTLRAELRAGLTVAPPALNMQWSGATNLITCTILWGDIQETPEFLGLEASTSPRILRATMTIVRGPLLAPSASTLLVNAATITNTPSAGGDSKSLGAQLGDMKYIGQPSTLFVSGGNLGQAGQHTIYAGMCNAAPLYHNVNDAISTTSTTGVNIGSTYGVATAIPQSYYPGLTHHAFARIINTLATLDVRIMVYINAGLLIPVYTSRWITPGARTGAYVYFGHWVLPEFLRATQFNSVGYIVLQARSNTGGSATGTVDYMETMSAYSMCRVIGPTFASGPPSSHIINSYYASTAAFMTSVSDVYQGYQVTGSYPFAITNAYLSLAWLKNNEHVNTDTITSSLTYIPQYSTQRGAT